MVSEKQQIILTFARNNNGQITKKQATELLRKYYYHNAAKYVGETLTRLVRRSLLKRIGFGKYKLSHKTQNIDSTQLELF